MIRRPEGNLSQLNCMRTLKRGICTWEGGPIGGRVEGVFFGAAEESISRRAFPTPGRPCTERKSLVIKQKGGKCSARIGRRAASENGVSPLLDLGAKSKLVQVSFRSRGEGESRAQDHDRSTGIVIGEAHSLECIVEERQPITA